MTRLRESIDVRRSARVYNIITGVPARAAGPRTTLAKCPYNNNDNDNNDDNNNNNRHARSYFETPQNRSRATWLNASFVPNRRIRVAVPCAKSFDYHQHTRA